MTENGEAKRIQKMSTTKMNQRKIHRAKFN